MNKIKIEKQKEWYTIKSCENNPNKLYIFGDNTLRQGCAGQAVIRYIDNSIGVATKVLPKMTEESFFTDDSKYFELMVQEIKNVKSKILNGTYDTLVFPGDGIGTGLSKMPTKSPKLYEFMLKLLETELGIKI